MIAPVAEAPVPDANPLRICFVGDSYVDGTGDPECLGWVGRLCRRAWSRNRQVTNYNLGIRGETSVMLAQRWRRECELRLPPGSPALLVFMFGLNDIAERIGEGLRVEPSISVAAAEQIVSAASLWQPTLWIGPPPANEACSPLSSLPGVTFDYRNDRLSALNAVYRSVAGRLGVPYLDIATPLSASPAYLASLTRGDRIHCDASGYAEIAALIDGWPAWQAAVDGKR